MRKLILPTLLTLIATLTIGRARVAYAASAIQIAPTSLEFEIAPGETYVNQDFNLFNPSRTEAQVMTPKVLDFSVEGETGTYNFAVRPNRMFSLSEWVTFSPSEITLEPLEVQTLTLTITAPEDAEPGGHYAMLLTSSQPLELGDGDGGVVLRAVGGVGAPLFATVPGEISWEGKILEVMPVPFKNFGPVDFKLRFQNLGTVHYKPYGKIEVFDFLNNKVGEVEIPPTRVFPQTIRQMEANWGRLLLIGKYRAKATLTYGKPGEEKTDTAEIAFWGFPYKGALVTLVTLGLVVAVSKLRKKEDKNSLRPS